MSHKSSRSLPSPPLFWGWRTEITIEVTKHEQVITGGQSIFEEFIKVFHPEWSASAGRSIGTTYHKPWITKFKLDQKGLNAGQFRSWFAVVENKVRTPIYYDSSTMDWSIKTGKSIPIDSKLSVPKCMVEFGLCNDKDVKVPLRSHNLISWNLKPEIELALIWAILKFLRYFCIKSPTNGGGEFTSSIGTHQSS